MKNTVEQGKRFGYLTLLFHVGKHKNYSDGWMCTCDCGNTKIRSLYRLSVGHTKTCGCKPSNFSIIKRYPLEYSRYQCMLRRVRYFNPINNNSYKGKNIKVQESWENSKGFENFLNDLGAIPSNKHELDRIDVNGDYCKDNCRWATQRGQSFNKSNTNYMEILGQKIPFVFVTQLFNINASTVRDRILNKLPFDVCFFKGDIRGCFKYREIKNSGFVFKKVDVPKEFYSETIKDTDIEKSFEKQFGEYIIKEFKKVYNE